MKSDSVVDNSEKKKAQLFRLGYFIWFDYFQNFEYINCLRRHQNPQREEQSMTDIWKMPMTEIIHTSLKAVKLIHHTFFIFLQSCYTGGFATQ